MKKSAKRFFGVGAFFICIVAFLSLTTAQAQDLNRIEGVLPVNGQEVDIDYIVYDPSTTGAVNDQSAEIAVRFIAKNNLPDEDDALKIRIEAAGMGAAGLTTVHNCFDRTCDPIRLLNPPPTSPPGGLTGMYENDTYLYSHSLAEELSQKPFMFELGLSRLAPGKYVLLLTVGLEYHYYIKEPDNLYVRDNVKWFIPFAVEESKSVLDAISEVKSDVENLTEQVESSVNVLQTSVDILGTDVQNLKSNLPQGLKK